MAAGKQFFLRGQELYQQGNYQAAWLEFSSAYEISPLPDLAFNLAQCELKMGRTKDAIAHYREFLAAKPNDPESASIRETIARLEQQTNGTPPPAAAPPPPPPPQRRRLPVISIALGSSALLFTLFGGIAVGVATSHYNSLASSCKPNCAHEDVQQVGTALNAGYAMFGLAGAAAVGAAIALPFELRAARSGSEQPQPQQQPPAAALNMRSGTSWLAEARF